MTYLIIISVLLFIVFFLFFLYKKYNTKEEGLTISTNQQNTQTSKVLGYNLFKDQIASSLDMKWLHGSSLNTCVDACNKDLSCKSVAEIAPNIPGFQFFNKGGCAYSTSNKITGSIKGIDTFVKLPPSIWNSTPSYNLVLNGIVSGSDIQCFGNGTSVSKCMDLCSKDKSCKSITEFTKGILGGEWKDGGCCYKNSDVPKWSSPGMKLWLPTKTSKFTSHKDQNVNGSDIQCFKDGSTLDKCMKLCNDDKTCKSVAEVPKGVLGNDWKNGGCCYKKSDIIGKSPLYGVNMWY